MLGRMREVPPRALPQLLKLLRSKDVRANVSARSAIEWLPAGTRDKAIPEVIRLLRSQPVDTPPFTKVRAHVPRMIAAHFLGLHGGQRGLLALREASQRRSDPVKTHIDAALKEEAGGGTASQTSGIGGEGCPAESRWRLVQLDVKPNRIWTEQR